MLKAIFAKHVKVGDNVLLCGGDRVTVEAIGWHGVDRVDFITPEKGLVVLHEYDIVGLGHRPWPEGKTEQVMGWAVSGALEAFSRETPGPDRLKRMIELREAIEVYELGRLQEPAKSEPVPENCYEGRCKHPKNFAGSCIVYLMDHPPQRNC